MGKDGRAEGSGSPHQINNLVTIMLPEVVQEIQEYTQSIFRGEIPEVPDVCPRCKRESQGFKVHEHRERTFLVVVEGWVQALVTWLVRFKCVMCKKTFTVYPDFALPYKRYALPVVADLSERYIDSDKNYRNCCREGLHRIGYKDLHLFAASTIWRWVGYVGGLKRTLIRSVAMLQQKSPSTLAHRKVRDVLPQKYRSAKRKKIIAAAWRLLAIRPEYEQVFGRPIFPRFATTG